MVTDDTREALDALERRILLILDGDRRENAIREEAKSAALGASLDLSNQRLDAMNEFREALHDQTALMITRTESEAGRNALEVRLTQAFRDVAMRIEAEIAPIRARVDQQGRPNWVLLVSSMSVGFVMIAAVWLVIGLKIDASLSPIAQEISQQRLSIATLVAQERNLETATGASTQSDANSKGDRAQLNSRMSALEGLVAVGASDRRASTTAITAQLAEIETQFHAMSDSFNTERDATQQWIGLLWDKTFNATIPPTRFRPQNYHGSIINRDGGD